MFLMILQHPPLVLLVLVPLVLPHQHQLLLYYPKLPFSPASRNDISQFGKSPRGTTGYVESIARNFALPRKNSFIDGS